MSRLTCRLSPVAYVLNSDTLGAGHPNPRLSRRDEGQILVLGKGYRDDCAIAHPDRCEQVLRDFGALVVGRSRPQLSEVIEQAGRAHEDRLRKGGLLGAALKASLLVVADGAWGIDHHLHENPELKPFAYAWLTDGVGWRPEPEADERRRYLITDANAEMLEQAERYPRVRDRALFIGDTGDLPSASFGAAMPDIRIWAKDHFTFTGPVADGGGELAAARLAELL